MNLNNEDDFSKFLDKESIDDFMSSFDDLPVITDLFAPSNLSAFDDLSLINEDLSALSYTSDNKYLETLLSENQTSNLVCPAPQLANDLALNETKILRLPSQPQAFLPTTDMLEVAPSIAVYSCNPGSESSPNVAYKNESANGSGPLSEAECKLMLIRRLTECDSTSPSEFAEVLLNAASQLRSVDKGKNGSQCTAQPPQKISDRVPALATSVSNTGANNMPRNTQFHPKSSGSAQGKILPRPVQCIAPAPNVQGNNGFNGFTAKMEPGAGGGGRLPVPTLIVSGSPLDSNNAIPIMNHCGVAKVPPFPSSTVSPQTSGALRQLILKGGPCDSNTVRVFTPSVISTPNQNLQPVRNGKAISSSEIASAGATTLYINTLPMQQATAPAFQPAVLSDTQPTITSVTVSPRIANEIGVRGQAAPANIATNQNTASAGVGRRSQQHNIIEKRYRMSINEKIDELRQLLPDDDSKGNKSGVLKRAIEYITQLKIENEQLRQKLVTYQLQCVPHHYDPLSPDYGSNGFHQLTPSFSDSSPSAHFSERELESPPDSSQLLVNQTVPMPFSLGGKRGYSGTSPYGSENNKMPRLATYSTSGEGATGEQLLQDPIGQSTFTSRVQSNALASRGVVMLTVCALLIFSPMDYVMGPWAKQLHSTSPGSNVIDHPIGTSRRLFSWEVLRDSPPFSTSSLIHVLLFWSLLLLQWFLAILVCIWGWNQRRVQYRKPYLAPARLESVLNLWKENYEKAKEDIRLKHWSQAYERLQSCRISLGHPLSLSTFNVSMDIISGLLVNLPILKRVASQNLPGDEILQKACFLSDSLKLQMIALGRSSEHQSQIISLCLQLWNASQSSIHDSDTRLESLFTIYAMMDAILTIPRPLRVFIKKRLWKAIINCGTELQHENKQLGSSWEWIFSPTLSANRHLIHWENMNLKQLDNDYLSDYFTGCISTDMSISSRMRAIVFIHVLDGGITHAISESYNESFDSVHELVRFCRCQSSPDENQYNIRLLWSLIVRDVAAAKGLQLVDDNVFTSCGYVQKLKDVDSSTELGRLFVAVLSLLSKLSRQHEFILSSDENGKSFLDELLAMRDNVDQFVNSICSSSTFQYSHCKHLFMNVICAIHYILLKSHLEWLGLQPSQQMGSHLQHFHSLLTQMEFTMKWNEDLYRLWSYETFLMKKQLRDLAQANPMKTTSLVHRYHLTTTMTSLSVRKSAT